jgi:hypothetical protein
MLTELGDFRFNRRQFRDLIPLRLLIGNLWQRTPAMLAPLREKIGDMLDLLGRQQLPRAATVTGLPASLALLFASLSVGAKLLAYLATIARWR